VPQIVIGLTSFWQTTEDTYGGVYDHDLKRMGKKGESCSDIRIRLAKESRDKVLNHEKWPLFQAYASAIGIDKVPEVPGWTEHQERLDKIEAALAEEKRIAEEKLAEEKRLAEERARKEEEERLAMEKEHLAKEKAEQLAKAKKIEVEYFKLIH